MSEKILVIDTREPEVQPVIDFAGVSINLYRLDTLMDYFSKYPMLSYFRERSEMEKDPTFLQVIPYVILQYRKKYCVYTRGGLSGEKRLVGSQSLGFGGHIIESDVEDSRYPFGTILKACHREVCEEVSIHGSILESLRLGLIRDCSNEVGTVHLGIVFLWVLESCRMQSNEKHQIVDAEFKTFYELLEQSGNLESWSKLCLPLLALNRHNL
jgi:predicted NUDIX family phosphoesterase